MSQKRNGTAKNDGIYGTERNGTERYLSLESTSIFRMKILVLIIWILRNSRLLSKKLYNKKIQKFS